MSLEKVLYRAQATSTGGREGTSRSSDGILDVKLTTPKELGGNGLPGTNPEQLFAAGYSACFLGALKFVAGKAKVALPARHHHHRRCRYRPCRRALVSRSR
jgi:Ohr subfamily peroxiredoxin